MWKSTLLVLGLLLPLAAPADNGIVSRPSPYSVAQTLDRLEAVLKAKGIIVFARIDHSGEAQKVGMSMRPTQLLIFGSPRLGTTLMNTAPSLAIDLPLKALAWEDANGQVWVSFNSPAYLGNRHGLDPELAVKLGVAGTLVDEAVK
jgi:uncharacterized protein (DUF302 family)